MHNIWTSRQRMVIKHLAICRNVGLVLGNTGYVIGILEYAVTDVVWLRIWAMVCAMMIVGYQLLMPKIQMLTVFWCSFYTVVNLGQLYLLFVKEGLPPLGWEEKDLHTLFSKHITYAEFQELTALGEWMWLVDGAKLTEQGHGGEDRHLYFLMLGDCEVSVDGRQVAELGPGDVVGEVGALLDESEEKVSASAPIESPAKAPSGSSATVTARGSVRCFAVPVREVHRLLSEKPDMQAPVKSLFSDALVSKVVAMRERASTQNYRAVLEVACMVDTLEGVADRVTGYRARHGVSDDVHRRLLEEVPQCRHRPFRDGGTLRLKA